MSLDPKLTNGIIVSLGLVSSLAALLMIIDFIGFEPNYQKVLDISSQAYASVADSLTGIANSLVQVKALVLSF